MEISSARCNFNKFYLSTLLIKSWKFIVYSLYFKTVQQLKKSVFLFYLKSIKIIREL